MTSEQRDLERYRDLLRSAWRSVALSQSEFGLLYDAMQDTFIDASTARQLVHDILISVRRQQLDEKWAVDVSVLCGKLAAYNDLQRMAILDVIERNPSGEVPVSSVTDVGMQVHAGGDEGEDAWAEWISQANAEEILQQRQAMRPSGTYFEVQEVVSPNMLLWSPNGWASWDATQQHWFVTDWNSLSDQYPMLPSQMVQRALQSQNNGIRIAADLNKCGCKVVYPKCRYTLPDNTMLTARWDGDTGWWFDVGEAGDLVLTVASGTWVLWAELRAELGMASRHRWRNGLFTLADLQPF